MQPAYRVKVHNCVSFVDTSTRSGVNLHFVTESGIHTQKNHIPDSGDQQRQHLEQGTTTATIILTGVTCS